MIQPASSLSLLVWPPLPLHRLPQHIAVGKYSRKKTPCHHSLSNMSTEVHSSDFLADIVADSVGRI